MLNPDLIKMKVSDTFISTIHYLPVIDSTNNYSKKIKSDNSLIIAEYQTKGRGRFNRKWISQKAKNILLTIRKKNWIDIHSLHYLNFFITYQIYSTLKSYLPKNKKQSLYIKWPNDVIWDKKKISGLLIETSMPSNIIHAGIGININQLFPQSSSYISLKQILNTAEDLDRNGIIIKLIRNIHSNSHYIIRANRLYLYKKWEKANFLKWEKVCLKDLNISLKPEKIKLTSDGAIIISSKNFTKKYYSSEFISFM
ncbi:MAG: biotin--[acetyl-CoA-carboxylase] ligase [Ignavibacteria bacterium]|nr:biotin--[acetyl-CoA-carboxylase] ligase [Ignavibacteria bacterium]